METQKLIAERRYSAKCHNCYGQGKVTHYANKSYTETVGWDRPEQVTRHEQHKYEKTCTLCEGIGQVLIHEKTFQRIPYSEPCISCKGKGKLEANGERRNLKPAERYPSGMIASYFCNTCNGLGIFTSEKTDTFVENSYSLDKDSRRKVD